MFVHGYRGSNDDFVPLLARLTANDPRYDGYVLAGTEDHASWQTRSIDRRRWLVAFDYYNKAKEDAREAYTAGPGRIGSNSGASCAFPVGKGNILTEEATYDAGTVHDYAADLAALVADVLRATGASAVDVVAHSMGGLVTRSFLAYYGGAAKVENLLLLASPVEGVGPIVFLEYIGLGQQSWMKTHEIAELDSGSVLSKARFVRCGEPASSRGAWAEKLLATERMSPPKTALYVMNGQLDFVSYGMTDHPLARSHDVVPGATHAGILEAADTETKVRALLGGTTAP